jgi:hypothetical protein
MPSIIRHQGNANQNYTESWHYLPSKDKALSSNPSTTRKTKQNYIEVLVDYYPKQNKMKKKNKKQQKPQKKKKNPCCQGCEEKGKEPLYTFGGNVN